MLVRVRGLGCECGVEPSSEVSARGLVVELLGRASSRGVDAASELGWPERRCRCGLLTRLSPLGPSCARMREEAFMASVRV